MKSPGSATALEALEPHVLRSHLTSRGRSLPEKLCSQWSCDFGVVLVSVEPCFQYWLGVLTFLLFCPHKASSPSFSRRASSFTSSTRSGSAVDTDSITGGTQDQTLKVRKSLEANEQRWGCLLRRRTSASSKMQSRQRPAAGHIPHMRSVSRHHRDTTSP